MKFVIGFAAGFALSLILAPARGEVTRRRLVQKARELMQVPREKAQEAAEAAKQRAGDLGAEVWRRAAESAVETVEKDLLGHEQTA